MRGMPQSGDLTGKSAKGGTSLRSLIDTRGRPPDGSVPWVVG
jgi:hypothetical protein